jgi:hypothetical protein
METNHTLVFYEQDMNFLSFIELFLYLKLIFGIYFIIIRVPGSAGTTSIKIRVKSIKMWTYMYWFLSNSGWRVI